MRRFRNRTLALVIASYIAVMGAFGADNYNNSLMSLNFDDSTDRAIIVNVLTKQGISIPISPIKKSRDTYIIMLPNMDSQMIEDIKYDGNIKDVEIRTMPYKGKNIGYTKLTIKTFKEIPLIVRSDVFEGEIPTLHANNEINIPDNQKNNYSTEKTVIRSRTGVDQISAVDLKDSLRQFEPSSKKQVDKNKSISKIDKKKYNYYEYVNQKKLQKEKGKNDITYVILISCLVLVSAIYLIIKAKNKLVDITGESGDYSVDDNESKKKKEKNSISLTINNLDQQYSKTSVSIKPKPISDVIESSNYTDKSSNYSYSDSENEDDIIDLDDLLKDEKKQEQSNYASETEYHTEVTANEDNDEENSALDDFLETFNFDEDEENTQEEVEEEQGINEELYQKCMNSENLQFTLDDIEKIQMLMNSEISDYAMNNLSEFMTETEIEKKPTAHERLEHFVTLYTVQQNISFTKKDVDSLYKLISVELDNNFIKDLRTNPERMQEMQKEIEKQKSKPHKTSEILTLNVKDMLPDLSEALRKQGNKKIQSEFVPEVVYYSEGYDVSTLEIESDDLPDLTKEIDNKDAYKSKPSASYQIVDNSYEVEKLELDSQLPDLEDVMKNPEKYEDEDDAPVKVDEKALLNNISNVTFVPFAEEYDKSVQTNDITVDDMQNEFNEFGENFEIVDSEEEVVSDKDNDFDDFESLYNGNYVDFDDNYGQQNVSITDKEHIKKEIFSKGLSDELLKNLQKDQVNLENLMKIKNSNSKESNEEISTSQAKEKVNIQSLMNKIKSSEDRRKSLNESIKALKRTKKDGSGDKNTILSEICVLDGERFTIVSACNFTDNLGCYLAKNEDGYAILGFIGDKIFKVKSYDKLNTEKIQSRISDKFDDGTLQYIVRIGIHKFVMNVRADGMEFVMDLC